MLVRMGPVSTRTQSTDGKLSPMPSTQYPDRGRTWADGATLELKAPSLTKLYVQIQKPPKTASNSFTNSSIDLEASGKLRPSQGIGAWSRPS